MSNCINSGINKIYVLTQFNSQSLNRHIARTYNLGNGVNFDDGFVEVCWIPSFWCLSMRAPWALRIYSIRMYGKQCWAIIWKGSHGIRNWLVNLFSFLSMKCILWKSMQGRVLWRSDLWMSPLHAFPSLDGCLPNSISFAITGTSCHSNTRWIRKEVVSGNSRCSEAIQLVVWGVY